MKVRRRLIVLFLLPASLLYVIFLLMPTAWAFYYSLFDWRGFGQNMTFIGLENFAELFRDRIFLLSLRNTLTILFLGGAIVFPLAFLLTILINSGVRWKKLFRALIFLPNVIAPIALTTLWAFVYTPKFGLLNNFLQLIGLNELGKTTWLASDKIFYCVLVAILWINVGYQLVLIMAGIDKIPTEYYEAARIEGASAFRMFWSITMPLIWDVITVAMVLWSIFALKMFEFPYAFSGLDTPPELYTVGIFLYIMGFGKRYPIYRLGYATATGVVLLFTVVLAVGVLRRLMRRDYVQY